MLLSADMLPRRREDFIHLGSDLLEHMQNNQYNSPAFHARINDRRNRGFTAQLSDFFAPSEIVMRRPPW